MLMSELVAQLKSEGVQAQHWHVRHLLVAGYVPMPQRDASGRFVFTDADMAAVRSRLEARQGRRRLVGRPATTPDLAAEAAAGVPPGTVET